MSSIGERLRRARLEQNISLESIARETRIGVRLLQAIEAEEFDKLPGGVFRKSFVLQYARFLGIDAGAIAAELQHLSGFEEAPEIPGQEVPRFGSDMPAIAPSRDWTGARNSLAALGAVFAVVLACAGLYKFWQEWSRNEPGSGTASQPAATAQVRAERPQTAAAPAAPFTGGAASGGPATAAAAAGTAASGAGAGTAATGGASAGARTPGPQNAAGPQEARAEAASGAQVSAAPASRPAPAGGGDQPVRVELSAGEITWLQIVSDGRRVFSEVLRPHETKVVQASERIRLLVGNAGGLDVSLNGKSIGPIGPRGQVRVVELTPAGFQIVQRKPPTEPL